MNSILSSGLSVVMGILVVMMMSSYVCGDLANDEPRLNRVHGAAARRLLGIGPSKERVCSYYSYSMSIYTT